MLGLSGVSNGKWREMCFLRRKLCVWFWWGYAGGASPDIAFRKLMQMEEDDMLKIC